MTVGKVKWFNATKGRFHFSRMAAETTFSCISRRWKRQATPGSQKVSGSALR
jgi:hypothetical protein